MGDGEKSANKLAGATGDRAVEHFAHKKDRDEIQERDTYPRSRDPRRSKG